MMTTIIELSEPTPARVLGVPITIEAGARLVMYSGAMDAGGVEVCRTWSPRADDGGPAALVPFVIWAQYLRAQGVNIPGEPKPATLRKHTVFEPCDYHAAMYASETRYRRAETMVEGGWADSPCPGKRCQMKPGTDFYTKEFVAENPIYLVGD